MSEKSIKINNEMETSEKKPILNVLMHMEELKLNLTPKEICKFTGWGRTMVSTRLATLVGNGTLNRSGKGARVFYTIINKQEDKSHHQDSYSKIDSIVKNFANTNHLLDQIFDIVQENSKEIQSLNERINLLDNRLQKVKKDILTISSNGGSDPRLTIKFVELEKETLRIGKKLQDFLNNNDFRVRR